MAGGGGFSYRSDPTGDRPCALRVNSLPPARRLPGLAPGPAGAGSSARSSFRLSRVDDGPSQSLDEVRGEPLALEVVDIHPLAEHDAIASLFTFMVSSDDYLRH